LNAASNILAAGAPTEDSYMRRVIQANCVYQTTGQAVWPWEVDELPDDWLDAIVEFTQALPEKMRKHG
jgi:hypothetical protein